MTDTDVQMEKNDFTVSAPSGPRLSTTPLSPTSACASDVRYGMRSAPATVVLKAEFAQSYIIQPKISRRSFTGGVVFLSGLEGKCFGERISPPVIGGGARRGTA